MPRLTFAVAGWLLAAVVAVSVGLLAVSLLGSGITGRPVQPLSQAGVARALARATASPTVRATEPPAAPTPSGGPSGATPQRSATPSPITRALDSPGGSVVARCADGRAYVVSWTPRQGFESEDDDRGPDRRVSVTFESDDLDVRVRVDCHDGVPVKHVRTERDD